jgi:hypothetical protein
MAKWLPELDTNPIDLVRKSTDVRDVPLIWPIIR